MQMKLKTLENFAALDMTGILDNAVRLEVAGVKSVPKTIKEEVSSVECVEQLGVASGTEEKLMARIGNLEEAIANISVGSYAPRGKRRRGGGNSNRSNRTKSCWNCGETSHLLQQCPKRFCPACGQQGHDVMDKRCPKSS